MRWRRAVWAAFALLALGSSGSSRAQTEIARRAQALTLGLDLEEARRVLSSADADDPSAALERARLAIYELDCDGAAAILARPELEKTEPGSQLGEIARGCQRVTAALVTDSDRELGIEVRWQDEHDRALFPLLLETVAKAREALSRDLGVDWPRPTRIVVVDDLLSLSAMTGLPYKSAQTTGTVAVAKWGRVTLLSPRASRHGYPWRDTVAHELTHLAVTRASRDRAPLWLQEGIAKREEVRWRDVGPFDDRPPADALVLAGAERKLDIPLDRLGPSIAMLPSADAAAVAFAEVTSFVRYYVQAQGEDALPKLLAGLKSGSEPDEALTTASGTGLKAWNERWRGYLATRPREVAGPLLDTGGDSAKGGKGAQLADVRDRSRLAALLLDRRHAPEAVRELDHIPGVGLSPTADTSGIASDAALRWLRARSLEGADRREEAAPLVADPRGVSSSFGPWWAVRGRWARLRGEEAGAVWSFGAAVAVDPFDPEGACESLDESHSPPEPGQAALCEAARAAGQPPFGE